MTTKQTSNIVQIISDDDKGKIAHQEADLETPVFYNDRINVLDDLESLRYDTWDKIKDYMLSKMSPEKLFFISHKEDEITGKPQLIEENQKRIVLVTEFKKRLPGEYEEGFSYVHKLLDDVVDRREGKENKNLSFWFWIYKVIDNSKEYILLTERKLNPDLYRFRGMKITLKDNSEISKTLSFKSLANVFISVEEDKAIKVLEKKQLIEHFKKLKEAYNLNEERFKENLFTNENNKIYSHTENYSKLMLSVLLSGKYEGYPLHLVVFGPAGTGKTTELECLNNLFQEEKGIFEAGSSTLKGIIPSFREKPASPGYMLNCVRIGLVDELFKMIEKTEVEHQSRGLDFLMNYLSQLNMFLEHKERTIGSGCDTIKAKATAKFIFMTNPYKKRSTIYEHVELMDITTLSRFVPAVQDYEERKLIDKKEIKENKNKRMSKEDFLTIFDSCQGFLIDYDEEKVKEIYRTTLNLTKEPMREVWKARGLHHSVLLLDGIVKLRCLFEENHLFKANQKDYDELEKTLAYIINSWDCLLRKWESGDRL